VVWPWAVRFCSSAQLRRISMAVICLSPALRLYLSRHHVDLYTNVFCRLDGLMAGAFLAIVVRADNFLPSKYIKRAWISLLIATLLAFLAEAFDTRWLVFSLSAAASASFLYLSLFSEQKWLRAWLMNRFMTYTGTISYGLYLLHKIPFGVVQALRLDQYPLLVLPIIFLASYAMAALSWSLLEKPFLRLKRFFESKPVSEDRGNKECILTN
jgi:peptidoglycan/LPS O-acetylase OafA/YrhL